MKKANKWILIILCLILGLSVEAQLKVDKNGLVEINAQTQDWWPALRVKVPTANSCAYNLWYNGKDRFYVHASGYLWAEKGGYFGSDIRLKNNIKKIESPLEKIRKINGIEFSYKNDDTISKDAVKGNASDDNNRMRLGFIAQDMEKVIPGVVKDMPNGMKAIAYTDLTALLVEALKEQQNIIDAQSMKIKELENKINTTITIPVKDSDSKKKSLNLNDDKTENTIDITNAFLFQNAPNPFSECTEIKYFVPENIHNAILYMFDLQGNIKKQVTLQEKGKTAAITINGNELQAGMYVYSLTCDGQIVDTKNMILTK